MQKQIDKKNNHNKKESAASTTRPEDQWTHLFSVYPMLVFCYVAESNHHPPAQERCGHIKVGP